MGGKPDAKADRHKATSAKITPAGRSSLTLILLTLGSYAATVLIATGFPNLMSIRLLAGPFSLAMILGALQMLLILLATGIYIRAANRREAVRELS